jgi:hypothetical protein
MKASLWDTLCRRRVTPLECGRQCRRQLQPRQKNMKTTTCSCLRWDVPLAESVRLRRTNRARTLLMRFGPVRESDVPEPPLAWAGQFCGPKLATLPGGGRSGYDFTPWRAIQFAGLDGAAQAAE